jgi:hypothetical protein
MLDLYRSCRGGFSHDNATLLGSASSAKQEDLQQLETLKPARSGKHISFEESYNEKISRC